MISFSIFLMSVLSVLPSDYDELIVLNDTLLFRDTCSISNDHLQMHFRVYLPASSLADSSLRYPVVYFLPGYDGSPASIEELFGFPQTLVNAMRMNIIPEFITVVVDPSLPGGLSSFYVNSPVTGNWEKAISQDLVNRIDQLFPTIPLKNSRIIAGFSVGGFGAAYCGLRNGEVFGNILSMSGVLTPDSLASIWIERASLIPEWTPNYFLENHQRDDDAFYARMLMSMYLCFNPKSNKTGAAAPFDYSSNGLLLPDSVLTNWGEYCISNQVTTLFTELTKKTDLPLKLFFSVGSRDNVVYSFGQEELSILLSQLNLPVNWTFHSYNGSHGGGIREVFTEGLLFLFQEQDDSNPEE